MNGFIHAESMKILHSWPSLESRCWSPPVESCGAVHHDHCIPRLWHHRRCLGHEFAEILLNNWHETQNQKVPKSITHLCEKGQLVVRVVSSCICHVVEDVIALKSKPKMRMWDASRKSAKRNQVNKSFKKVRKENLSATAKSLSGLNVPSVSM